MAIEWTRSRPPRKHQEHIAAHVQASAAQQKNMELLTFSWRLGSSCTGALPADVCSPWLEDVSDISSNFMNCPTWAAARCA